MGQLGETSNPDLFTEDESEAVGWDGELIETYPTLAEVVKASRAQLIEWYRYLDDPNTEFRREIVQAIIKQLMAGVLVPFLAQVGEHQRKLSGRMLAEYSRRQLQALDEKIMRADEPEEPVRQPFTFDDFKRGLGGGNEGSSD
jgi:hypothetical protein